MAVERNMIDIMDLFLQCGGDPTIQNQHGFTCLHISVREGQLDMTKFLLSKGKLKLSHHQNLILNNYRIL